MSFNFLKRSAIVFGIAWVVGIPFGLGAEKAALLAAVALCFWFPGFANVHIAISGEREKRRARISAAIRAFGILLCSAVSFIDCFSVFCFVPISNRP